MKPYLKLMRVHHYIKNLLILAALACSGQFFSCDKLAAGLFGLLSFCMMPSVVYIVNDIRDIEKDKVHPTKCGRPIASGAVSVRNARILAAVLLVGAVLFNFLTFNVSSTLLMVLYLLLNLAYSFGLKNIPLIDVTILVSGFLIRVLYGAIITEITISNWLYMMVIAIAFYFALGKRRNELKKINSGETRKVLRAYPADFLDRSMYMCLALANVFYALWSMDEKTARMYSNSSLVWTFPIVLLITLRYSMNIEGDSDGDPVEVLLHDKVLLTLCAVYLTVMFMILYL